MKHYLFNLIIVVLVVGAFALGMSLHNYVPGYVDVIIVACLLFWIGFAIGDSINK
jgi:hypothetical protein